MRPNQVSTEQFDCKLSEILDEMTGEQIMMIPGVYEVVSEHFNNEVLDAVCADHEEDGDNEAWDYTQEQRDADADEARRANDQ